MTRILQPIQTTWLDYPDNESLAIIVCMMGCDNGCFMCQNPDFQNANYSNSTKEYTVDGFMKEIEYLCKRNFTDKIVLSGGDPLSPCNIDFTKEFLSKTSLDVCIYTGHSIEYVKEHFIKGFKFIKCGKFEYNNLRDSFKTDELIQFASPNQCLYNSEYELISENGIYKFN